MRHFLLPLGFALLTSAVLDATSQEFRIPFEVFARQAFETVRDKSGLKNLKYDMVGCDYALDANGRVVPSIGVFTETESHEAKSSGYTLIHSDIIPTLSEGRLTFAQKTTIADFRLKVGGWAEWINNVVAVASLGRADVRIEDFVEAFARDEASKKLGSANERANQLLKEIRAGAFINSVEIAPTELVIHLGSPGSGPTKTAFSIGDALRTGSGRIHSIQEWSPPGRSKDDARTPPPRPATRQCPMVSKAQKAPEAGPRR